VPTVAITDHTFPSIDPERRVLEAAGCVLAEINPACKTEDDVVRNCGAADVLLVQWAPITRRVLESLPQVRCIVRYGIGVDNIDIQSARALGRMVANVPRYCQEEVSDHTVAMILSLTRRIAQDHYQIAHGGWGISPFVPIPAFSDMTVGLVGFGSIARKVSDKLKPFRFRQVAFDPQVEDKEFRDANVERVDLDALLASADVISLHCPLLDQTRHMINRTTISQMKPRVIFVNTARGGLVMEADLIDALKSGRMLGAGLDVFEKEPLPSDSPLRTLPNVLLTSHAASASERARELLQTQAAESVVDFLNGRRPIGALI
jgi:D-3-phosphoglycerate dehydrogenase / 2-oxoglutarate reductase